MSREPSDKPYSEEESKRRFEAALKGALKTPHKLHKDEPARGPKGKDAKDGTALDGKASRPRHQD